MTIDDGHPNDPTCAIPLDEFLFDVDGLIHLDGKRVGEWITAGFPSERRRDVWNQVCTQWLDLLAEQLPGTCRGIESEHFFLVAEVTRGRRDRLIQMAEQAWSTLREILGDAVRLSSPGKQVILAFNRRSVLYQYAAPYFPEGKSPTVSGVFCPLACPLILIRDADQAVATLVHELLHASVTHLTLPEWLEEGLAQIFELDHGEYGASLLTPEEANNCRSFWRTHELSQFWYGRGFHQAGRYSEESYRLARILARLLLDDAKPGWWGLGRARQQRFIRFVVNARAEDAGEESAQSAYGHGIAAIAERFLGSLTESSEMEPDET